MLLTDDNFQGFVLLSTHPMKRLRLLGTVCHHAGAAIKELEVGEDVGGELVGKYVSYLMSGN